MKKSFQVVFFVGPLTPPIHGQSLAFTRFVDSIKIEKKIVLNTNLENRSKIGKLFGTVKNLFSIFLKVFFLKFDIVYFTCSRSFLGSIKDVLLINLVSLKNVKIINHLHGSDFYDFLHSSPQWYQKILFASYEKVNTSIVLLESMKDQFKDFKNMKVEVVANFYDKELDNLLVEKEVDNINLVYLSNIMKSKGIFELIEAFEELSQVNRNLYLNIAGDFMADEYMNINQVKQEFYAKIEQNTKIRYHGKVFEKEKTMLLQKSDIFILPSYYRSEAFPISIIEAMACENAIITTNYKYLPEIVKESNGVLVETNSIKSLKDGIEKLLHNKDRLKTIQMTNRQKVKEQFTLELYLKKLHEIVLEER